MTGIIAHRGFNGLYPENTRRAFEEALKLDIAGIECDVNLSKDGQVVVIHDLTVDRTSNGSGEVAQLLVDDLKQLNVGTDDDPQEIMLLDELLDLLDEYPGKHILIETKHPSPFGAALEEAVAHVLQARGMEADERVHLISFNPEAIERFQRLLPEIETFLLVNEPFAPVGDCSAGPSVREAKAHPGLFDGQLRTYVWTVNLPRDMEWLHQHGATLIGTDLPHIALQTLS